MEHLDPRRTLAAHGRGLAVAAILRSAAASDAAADVFELAGERERCLGKRAAAAQSRALAASVGRRLS